MKPQAETRAETQPLTRSEVLKVLIESGAPLEEHTKALAKFNRDGSLKTDEPHPDVTSSDIEAEALQQTQLQAASLDSLTGESFEETAAPAPKKLKHDPTPWWKRQDDREDAWAAKFAPQHKAA